MTEPYRILWGVLMQAPNGLPVSEQWLFRCTATEAEAIAELQRLRPEWTVLQVTRVKSP